MTLTTTTAPEVVFDTQIRVHEDSSWSVKMGEKYMYRMCPFRMNMLFEGDKKAQRCSTACTHCTLIHGEDAKVREVVLTCTNSTVHFRGNIQ